MGVNIDISNFKCFNKLRNGEDFDQNLSEFTPNLVGNVGEEVMVQYNALFYYNSSAEGGEEWYVKTGSIERSSGNFIDDGLIVGNKISFFPDWINRNFLTNVEFQATIDTITSDGKTITFTVTSGSQTTIGTVNNVGFLVDTWISAENRYTALLMRFGLIENDESYNVVSKVSERDQVYYASELVIGVTKALTSLGKLKDWVSGSATVLNTVGTVTDGQYVIKHRFVINPWYILGFRENLVNNTIPQLYDGNSSLKYAFDLELRQTLTDIRSSKKVQFDERLGVVGWFGENFNGFNNVYGIVSVAYEDADTTDALEGIGINNRTKVTVVVERLGGSITSDFSASAHVSILPTSESQYKETETNLLDNFIYGDIVLANPDTSNTNTGVITSIDSNISAGKLTLEYVVEYDAIQKLNLTTNVEYMTWVQIEDSTIATGNSDRVAMLVDLRGYVDVDYVAGFVTYTNYEWLTHELERGVDPPKAAITDAINEDGIALVSRFSVDTTKDVVINSVKKKLIARDTISGTFFELDNYNLDISSVIVSGGTQQFNIIINRGYDLVSTDQFNQVELITKELSGSDQFFEEYFSQKIKWQDWLPNDNVDTVFFDNTEPNDNLNFKSSNYSELNNYEIYLATIINVSGEDDLGRDVTGDFTQLGTKIIVDDYNSSGDITGVIETFDPDTLSNLGGAVLYNGKDTIFKTTYTRTLIEDVDYAIHRIEASQSIGDGIQELSTIITPPANNIIVPLEGETQLKITNGGATVTTECLISGSKIQEGIDYKLSARLGQGLIDVPSFVYSVTVGASETISLPMFNGDDSLYNAVVTFGDGSGEKVVTAYGDADREHEYVLAGTYDITISGLWDYILFVDNPTSIIEVKDWGTASVGEDSFKSCVNFDTITATSNPTIHNNTLMGCFDGATTFNQDIGGWDVSGVTDMNTMFSTASVFNQDINSWDVSSVTDMKGMFKSAVAFNQALNSWNVSSVTDFSEMFRGATFFNSNIASWNTSAATTMGTMFFQSVAFNQDIGGWDVSGVTNMSNMFNNANDFNQDIGSWIVSSVVSMSFMFSSAWDFNQDISSWNVAAVTNMSNMFSTATVFNQDISSWNVAAVTNMSFMFRNATAFEQDIGGWDITSVTDMTSMFLNVTLTTSNYDNILVGWEAQLVQNNVAFHGGNSTYTSAGAGGTARAALIADHTWTITDGGGI